MDLMPETPEAARGPIPIQLTVEDVANAYHLLQKQALLTVRGVASVIFFDLVTVALTVVVIKGLYGDDLPLPMAGVLALVFPIALIWGTRIRNARLARRVFAQQKSLNMPFTLSWSDEALVAGGNQGTATLPWRDLIKMKQDAGTILFFESDVLFRLIPRRVLSEAQQDDLLQTARAHMEKKTG